MDVLNQNIDRRTLLKSAAALGVSAALPAFLAGCGSGSNGSGDGTAPGGDLGGANPVAQRETHDLNFDLSGGAVTAPYLVLPASKSDKQPLKVHTTETRAQQRQKYPMLSSVPDDKLTHYLDGVDLPAGALQQGYVWGKHPKTGETVIVSHFFHVPQQSLQNLAQTRVKRGQTAQSVSAKLSAYGAALTATVSDASTPVAPPIAFNSPPWDVAVAMVFSHPQITNAYPDLGADILDRINSLGTPDGTPYIAPLAQAIGTMIGAGGFPTTTNTGSWAYLQPMMDFQTNQQIADPDGTLAWTYQVNGKLDDIVNAVVRQILDNVNNDTTFKGTNWRVLEDTANSTPALRASAAAVKSTLKASGGYQIASDFKVGKLVNGIKVEKITTDSDRDIVISCRNYFLRTLGVYVEFQDAAGNTLPLDAPTGMDHGSAKWCGPIMADNQIMGIPCMDNWTNPAQDLSFTFPSGATTAKVHFGSLGLGGGDPFTGLSAMGALSTLFLNMVFPAFFIAVGMVTTWQKEVDGSDGVIDKAFRLAVTDPAFIQVLVDGFVGGGSYDAVQASTGTLSIKPFVDQMIKVAVGLIGRALPILGSKAPDLIPKLELGEYMSAVARNCPAVGLALWVASISGNVISMTETLVEVLCTPSMKTYTLTLELPTTVVISYDPLDFQFPATATHYVVSANYGGGATPFTATGTVSSGRTADIVVPLVMTNSDGTTSSPASGGQVTASVSFYDDQDTLVGQGTVGPVANMAGSDGTLTLPITIKELLVPLSSQTTYQHQSKLVYQNGAHVWSKTAPPPALTRSNLCQGNDGAICALHGITVNTASGMAGSSYDAGGNNSIRNIFLGDNPDKGQQYATGATAAPMGMAYAPVTSPVGGHAFFLQVGADNLYHLRSVNLTPGASFDMKQTTSWGRFHTALDSLTVTDNGTVVGVNRQTHKMEVLGLPSNARDSDNNIDSKTTNFAVLQAGKGSRAGTLDTPVATASYGNVVLVLEQGNKRVQAFDTDGNVLNVFTDASGNPTPLMPLQPESTSVQYLDIAVEGLGYMYVLSYTNDGTTPGAYRLDLYSPTGQFLSRTTGVAAGNIAVDLFRNVYSLNYETIGGAPTIEPSISQWLPRNAKSSTPASLFSRISAQTQQKLSSLLFGKSSVSTLA